MQEHWMSFELAATRDLEIMFMCCAENNKATKWDQVEHIEIYIEVATKLTSWKFFKHWELFLICLDVSSSPCVDHSHIPQL